MRTLHATTLLGLLLATACSGPPKLSNGETELHMKTAAKLAVQERLRDPGSARFDAIAVHDRGGGKVVVCGLVNSKNGFGGYAGDTPFLYRDHLVTLAQADSPPHILAAFAAECSD
jgi:hypothetical protein